MGLVHRRLKSFKTELSSSLLSTKEYPMLSLQHNWAQHSMLRDRLYLGIFTLTQLNYEQSFFSVGSSRTSANRKVGQNADKGRGYDQCGRPHLNLVHSYSIRCITCLETATSVRQDLEFPCLVRQYQGTPSCNIVSPAISIGYTQIEASFNSATALTLVVPVPSL